MKRRISLGLDSSTQSLTAVAIDSESGEILIEHSVDYAMEVSLLRYGIDAEEYLVPPRVQGEADQPPRLYLASIDLLLSRLKSTGFDFSSVTSVNVSGQQHGHLYLNGTAVTAFAVLKRPGAGEQSLVRLLDGVFAYGTAPIWKSANTESQAEEIRFRMGGSRRMIEVSGSDSPLRFTGTIIRRVAQEFPAAYKATARIQLISSFIPAVLTGNADLTWDIGNACGTSLMDYRRRVYSDDLLAAVAGDLPGGAAALKEKLPPLAEPTEVVGQIATYFVERYGFSPDCAVLAGSGDNPQSKVLAAGDLLSLGSSVVIMVGTDGSRLDFDGYANAMYDGLGRPFMFGCRTNGAMVWDRVRFEAGYKKSDYAAAEKVLSAQPPGEELFLYQPFGESFPRSSAFEPVRVGYAGTDFRRDYPGIIDSTLSSVYCYSRGFTRETNDPLYVTGGPVASPEILRRIAAIWRRPVVPIGSVGAGLGAAVAGAFGAARAVGRILDPDELSALVLPRGETYSPRPADIDRYHGEGGYLSRFKNACSPRVRR